MQASLVNIYGCKYEGSAVAPPYCSEMDMPDYYRAPDGKPFSVPQPDGLHYDDFILPMLIEKHDLQVVNSAYAVNED
jgi:hypothetical protein